MDQTGQWLCDERDSNHSISNPCRLGPQGANAKNEFWRFQVTDMSAGDAGSTRATRRADKGQALSITL